MAARLMMKFPGAVTCDDSTRSKSGLPVEEFTATPPVQLKGISDPESIFYVSTKQ